MISKRLLGWSALLAIATTAAAGCGSDSTPASSSGPAPKTLSKAEVIAEGTAICTAAERRIESLPQVTSEHPFSAGASPRERRRALIFVSGYGDALASVRADLAALSPPAEGRGLLEGFVAELGPTVAAFRQGQALAGAGRGTPPKRR